MKGDYFFIYFPSEFTSITAGACKSSLYPEEASIYPTFTSLGCTFVSSGNYFKITSVELKANSFQYHKILIEDITNPPAGGTGNFKIETRRGNLNVLDYNHHFESVGIVGNPNSITVSSFSRTKSDINVLSDYTFTISTSTLLPKNGSVQILIVNSRVKFTSQSSCSSSIGATVICNFTNNQKVVFSVLQ